MVKKRQTDDAFKCFSMHSNVHHIIPSIPPEYPLDVWCPELDIVREQILRCNIWCAVSRYADGMFNHYALWCHCSTSTYDISQPQPGLEKLYLCYEVPLYQVMLYASLSSVLASQCPAGIQGEKKYTPPTVIVMIGLVFCAAGTSLLYCEYVNPTV